MPHQQISEKCDSIKTDLIRFLRELVAIQSFSGLEKQAIERIKAELEKLGYDEIWLDGMGNLFGRMGHGKSMIAFDGHCDTVGIGNPNLWDVDPFEGKFDGTFIHGRGSCDQKGGLASAIYAGKIFKDIGIPDQMCYVVAATVLEEDYEGLSWKYILENSDIRPDLVVMTEPTDLQIKIGQRGRMEMKVKTEGISCHGSVPDNGVNAIYKMMPLLTAISELNSNLKDDGFLGKGSITVTDIRSDAPSLCAVPDSSIIHLDRRLTLDDSLESCLKEITALPSFIESEAKIQVPEIMVKSYTGLKIPLVAFYPAWIMERDHHFVALAEKAFQLQFSTQPITDVWQFSTNGVATKGLFDIPTIGFGPGEELCAHTPFEKTSVDHLLKAVAFYAALSQAFGNR